MADWYVTKDGRSNGPYSFEDLVAYIQQGQLCAEDHVFAEGWTDWQTVRNTPELAQHLSQRTWQPTKPHRGTIVVTCGVLGFCCVPIGIVALAMGTHDLGEMRAGRMDPAGEGMTRAGQVCGIITLGFQALMIVFYVFQTLR